MSRLIFLGCLAYLTIGLGQLVLGAVMEPLVHRYGIQYGDGGQLVMNQFLGGLFGTLVAPWLIRRFGRKSLLLSAFGIMAIIEFLYMGLPAWSIMLTIAPVTGFGFGIVEALIGSLIIGAAGDRANHAMSRVEVFFGVGALIIPFASAALIEIEEWRLAFGIVGALSVLSLLFWWRFWPTQANPSTGHNGHDRENAAHGSRSTASWTVRTGIIMGACILFFVVYVGLEMSFVHYLPSVLVQSDKGVSEATATLSLCVFWGAMTIGRFLAGTIADRVGGGIYLLVTCGVSAVVFALMSLTGGVTAMFVLTFFAGLFLSGTFAIALVFTNRSVPGITEQTTSLLIASGLLGGAILPKLAGWSLDRFEVAATRWLFTAVAGIMLLLIAVAYLNARRGAGTASEAAAASPASSGSGA